MSTRKTTKLWVHVSWHVDVATNVVKHRCDIAWGRFGEYSKTLMSAQLPVSFRCRLYNSLISSSTLAYGCEAWKMTLPVQIMINSTCSKQLALITKIKRRRHEYLGHILRLDPSRLLHRFIVEILPLHKQGSLITSEVPLRPLDVMRAASRR